MRLPDPTRVPELEDLSQVRAHLERLLSDVSRAVNRNEGSAIIEVSGSLPTASADWLGLTVHLRLAPGANDTLHWCREDAGGGYSWVTVA
jgi:hypothetical protein